MSQAINTTKNFRNGGMNQDDAPEVILPNDYVEAHSIRQSGSSAGEDGYTTNIESNQLIPGTRASGITKAIGSAGFEEQRIGIGFIYNSSGYHQIVKIDTDTQVQTVLFTNLTDSGNIDLLHLDPQNYVDDIRIINNQFLIWNDAKNPIGFTDYLKLGSGAYGTVLEEDFSLIKPQPLPPATAYYASDSGRASNFLKGKLFQITSQWVGYDYTYSAFATWSKRIVPLVESTPSVGTDVTQNNCIVITVNIGSIRVQTINIAARIGTFIYNIIKSVDRAYVLTLPNTAIDIANEVYEAYDPSLNEYLFVFYNQDESISVPPTTTDLAYDAVPQSAGAMELVNGNLIALGDLRVGYPRPNTSVTLAAIGYDPNITVPLNTSGNPLKIVSTFPGSSGSGAGDHKRIMRVTLGGVPATNDSILIILADIRNASNTQVYPYPVPSGQNGDLGAVVASYTATLPRASFSNNGDGTYTITFIGDPYFGLQSATVTLYNAGLTVFRSIHAVLDNSSYTLALSYRDKYGRFFPLDTNNTFIVPTPSYAQVLGQAIQISWTINDIAAPQNAVDYQWVITPNANVETLLDVLSTPLTYAGTWNAKTNTPTLAPNSGGIGVTYQIATPPDPSTPVNLGNGTVTGVTGDYVVYNGKSWDLVSKIFGDLTTSGNILALKIDPLALFNQKYTNAGADTVLSYDFADGDRATLHYYIDGSGNNVFINNPCVDLQILGFDPTSNIVKIEKSATFDESTIAGKDVFIRLYSPRPETQSTSTAQNTQLWYEIGERFTITNGNHDVLSGNITDGDVYYKTRQYSGAIDPNTAYEVLATDFNFSDFYPSAFTSYGRPRSFYDELEATERKALITWSQEYVLGSRVNGLTRFYPENVYGTHGGETSAIYGAIVKLLQINNILLCIQQLDHGSIPIYSNILEDQAQIRQVAISEKIFNNIRYTYSKHIGIGNAKESVAVYSNVVYWIDPLRSEPVRWDANGCLPISMKMSKFFKTTLQSAYGIGLKIIGWYDTFNDEYIISIQRPSGVTTAFSFNNGQWAIFEPYTISPSDIISVTDGSNCAVALDGDTGIATYTPASNYVGGDSAPFHFNSPGGVIAKNVCLNWTAGSSAVNSFSFTPLINQPLTQEIQSNTISVSENTIPASISITGGEYSINGAAYTGTAGTVNAGDIVQVRVLSSGSYSTATSCTLTIDIKSATFTVTTGSSGSLFTYMFYNTASTQTVQEVDITGTMSYTYGPYAPGSTDSQNIASGTYSVDVESNDAGGSFRRCVVNGVTLSTTDPEHIFHFSGVTTPITIRFA